MTAFRDFYRLSTARIQPRLKRKFSTMLELSSPLPLPKVVLNRPDAEA
jgi:hypothetical protein